MNFGEGTSRNTRSSLLRDPEFIPAIMGNKRTPNVTVRQRPRLLRPVMSPGERIRRSNRNRLVPNQRPPLKDAVQQPQRTSQPACPICMHNIITNSELSVKAAKCCGYIFCEPCIIKCAEQFKACPMCNQKLSTNGLLLLRVYQNVN